MKFVDTYVIQRGHMSTSSGCHGGATYDRAGGNPHGCPQPRPRDIEDLLGRDIGVGSIVRVTVELLHEEPLPETCTNPWSGHAPSALRRIAKGEGPGHVYESCIGRDQIERKETA